jgi:iron complex outermembrane receptor protein
MCAMLATAAATEVFAQETAGVEEVVVTGSRILRNEFESASPVSVYSAQDIRDSSANSLDEFLSRQPEFAGALGTTTNNGNNGTKMVDLRGLGYKRTLVLINGRRQVGSFVGSALDLGAVDLNSIPLAMVERVEVLKDGASTVYGSDAIAGVINVILRDRFEGVEFSGSYGKASENWDTKQENIAMTMGAVSDKSNVTLGLEYQNQDETLQGERKWGEFATWPILDTTTGQFVDQRLGSSNSRTIRDLSAAASAQIVAAGGPDTSRFTVDPQTGLVRAYDSATDTYNYAPINALMTPNERWQLTALGNSELFSGSMGSLNAYGELEYTKRTSHQRLAPDASFGDVSIYQGNPNNFVPASNPYNPFGVNGATLNPWGVTGESVDITRRFVESGGRLFDQNVNTFRMVAGFNGEVGNGIHWDGSYVYANNEENYQTKNYGRFDRWAIAVDPVQCAADLQCAAAGVLNPFSPYGGISPQQMAFLSANSLKDVYQTKTTTLTFNIGGQFYHLPGGPIGWSAGVESRSESAEIQPDEFSSGGLTTGGALSPLNGSYNVNEAYVEFLLPVLADARFAKSLDIEASARLSDYNTNVKNTDNYRLGFDWAIDDQIRLRGVYSTGFRAPNMVEYLTQAVTFPIAENWCEFTDRRNDISAVAKANCALLGFPADYEQGFQDQPTYSQTAATGINQLSPEQSTTYTAGVVLHPAFVEGLQMSVDWYNIKVDDYIALPDYNQLVKACLESVGFSAPACATFQNSDPLGGQTGVDRLDAPSGGLTQPASTTLGNLGQLETTGVDFGVDYTHNVNWGFVTTLGFGVDATYTDEYKISFPLTGSYELVGTAGYAGNGGTGVYPEWRANTKFSFGTDIWTVQWIVRWMDECNDFYRPASITSDAKAEAVYYNDLVVRVNWDKWSFVGGVDNVADEDPPLFHSGFNMHTATGVYDTIGRKVWMTAKMSL